MYCGRMLMVFKLHPVDAEYNCYGIHRIATSVIIMLLSYFALCDDK